MHPPGVAAVGQRDLGAVHGDGLAGALGFGFGGFDGGVELGEVLGEHAVALGQVQPEQLAGQAGLTHVLGEVNQLGEGGEGFGHDGSP
ncbi:hypothetical protein D3C72_1591070 [compost metagenome]